MTEHDKKHAPEPEEKEILDAADEGAEMTVDFEPEDDLGDIGAAKAKLKKLKDELEKVKKERQEYLDGWQRSKADAINDRRDAAMSADRAAQRAKESIVEDLIPVLDSFDMAYGSPAWETIDATWRSGIDQIRNQLLDVLKRNGIDRFGKTGEMYDPYLHDALQESDDDPGEPGSITRVLRYGYRAKDKVLRPAQVVLKSALKV